MSKFSSLGENSIDIIDLGMHAFADTFIPPEKLDSAEPIFPLICSLNEKTGYIHNKYSTEAFERYNLYDYSYTSSNSIVAQNHWIEFSKFINKLLGNEKCKVIEIGANDGFLCTELEKYDYETIAIDSSKTMTELSLNLGLDAINMIFNYDNISNSKLEINFYDCIIANNVFNHANDPIDFLIATHKLLKTKGYFIFEVPYWLNLIKSQHFDQIYHEHVSYFTLFSLRTLMFEAGFKIMNFDVVDYHGGSLRVIAVKDSNPISCEELKIEKQISTEFQMKLFEAETYVAFQKQLEINRSKFLTKIHEIKLSNDKVPIIGVGAAAKANTLLTYYGLNNTYIDFITDMSRFKIGKFTPLTRIPIYPDNKISELQDLFAIILSWNISHTLVNSLSKINRNVRFINL